MSHRHSDRRHDAAAHAGAQFHPRGAVAGRRSAPHADYTLGHAGRQVRLGPVAFWTVVGTLVIMAVWSVATATYFAFRDDLLTRLIARQAEMQYAYEDRVAELRSQVDRLTSRQLLDQEQFEQKLDHLMRRQATLESRASTLSGVADPTPTGSIKPPARATDVSPAKPSPINDTVILVPPPDREARLESRSLPTVASRVSTSKNGAGVEASLAQLQDSLDRVEARQASMLNGLEESFDAKARRMRSVLGDLGLDVGKMPTVAAPAATSTGSSTASISRALRSSTSIARSSRCRSASRSPARSRPRRDSACGWIRSSARSPCIRGSISAATPASRCAPPRPARSSRPGGAAATARWSKSTMATDCPRAMDTSRPST